MSAAASGRWFRIEPIRIAVLADTHLRSGLERLTSRCLEIAREADALIHVGDFSSLSVLQNLRELGPPMHAVHGNVDEPALRAELPERVAVSLGGIELGLIHDAGPARGRLARMRREFPNAGLVIFGHSHMPLVEREDDFAIFNPGSPTQRRRAPTRTMGLISVGAGDFELELIDLGRPAVR